MARVFELGETYSRPEIRTLVGDPKTKGGYWERGYRRWGDEFFIFAGVGTVGRTGHDYNNYWIGEHLAWQAATGRSLGQGEIDSLLSGQFPVHLFTRSNQLDRWTYRGLASPVSVRDTTPVEVLWAFDSEPAALTPASADQSTLFADGGDDGEAADPRTETESRRAVRLGQSRFRRDLMDRWDRRCALTGLPIPELLRASHIKPWRHCTPRERIDPENGLLLALHVDGLFDRGLISFEDDGSLIWSHLLPLELGHKLGLEGLGPIKGLTSGIRKYLAVHRSRYLKR